MYPLASDVRLLPTSFVYQQHSTAGYLHYKMKHLDVIDGEIAGVPQDQRPSPCIIGQNLLLLYLKLRLSDAETWMVYTATPSVVQLGNASLRDYVLQSNGLVQRTPCDCTHSQISISTADENLLTQLDIEGIRTSRRSIIHVVTVFVQQSYTDLAPLLSFV